MPDALLLDWEGCIADTIAARCHALARALEDEGVRVNATVCASGCEGASVADSVRRAFAAIGMKDDTLAELVALRASRTFAERLGKGFVLQPGARELVDSAQACSRVAIVTLATRSETEFVLRLSGLDAAVSTIVSADDGLEPPPSAAMFTRALAQLARRRSTMPARSVALAQTADMLRGARSAGLKTVAVSAPAHVALEADGAIDTLGGTSVASLSRIAGIGVAERVR